jgi:hypothetical protein
MSHRFQVTFDAAEPARLAEFWALALGYEREQPPPGFDTWEAFGRSVGIPVERLGDYDAIDDPSGSGPRVFFQRVPEGKTAKNRVHLDVNAGAGIDDEAERHRAVEIHAARLVEAGATLVGRFDEPTGWWIVMQDPEGNEFCVQ